MGNRGLGIDHIGSWESGIATVCLKHRLNSTKNMRSKLNVRNFSVSIKAVGRLGGYYLEGWMVTAHRNMSGRTLECWWGLVGKHMPLKVQEVGA